MREEDVPQEASQLHQQARAAGARGDYENAISLLIRAHQLAPDWPYPVYDMAFTYLLMNDSENARTHYRETVRLSPRGFFTAITALAALDKEAEGKLPQGTYVTYMSLEWTNDSAKKQETIRSLVQRVPQFAPVWKEYALICHDADRKLEAIEKGLAADPDAETLGILMINQALTLHKQGNKEQAKQILGDLAADPKTTFANEHLAKNALGFVCQ